MCCKRAFYFLASIVAVSLFVAGCDDGPGGGGVQVSGMVTYNGTPLQHATVTFFQKDPKDSDSSTGRTDEQGQYSLFIKPGDYKVTVSKDPNKDKVVSAEQVDPDVDPMALMNADMENADPSQVQEGTSLEEIPEQYSHPQKTQLKFTVPSGGTDSANFTNLTGA